MVNMNIINVSYMIHEDLLPNVSYMIHAIKSYIKHEFKKYARICDTLLDRNLMFQFENFNNSKKRFGH